MLRTRMTTLVGLCVCGSGVDICFFLKITFLVTIMLFVAPVLEWVT